jgi:hypothetical protein
MVEVENVIEDVAVKPIEKMVETAPKMLERISALEAYLQALFAHFHAKDPADPPPAPPVAPYPGPPPSPPGSPPPLADVSADELNKAELIGSGA